MYTINDSKPYILEQKKSKFIGLLYNVKDTYSVKDILENLKTEYKDATHICYAYKINDAIKCFDDNEPNKTAGFKILDAITSSNLDFVLGVVIRYFGGVKLGIGPLSRCYYKVTKEAIKNSKLIEIDNKISIILETTTTNLKLLNNITKNFQIINKQFNETVIYEVKIDEENLDSFIKTLENTNITYKKKD
ncbi:MAG: YigZ family protein [bacterium]|nr:YigZ family protein [bacterium]